MDSESQEPAQRGARQTELNQKVRTYGTSAAIFMALLKAVEIVLAILLVTDLTAGDPEAAYFGRMGAPIIGGGQIVICLWIAALIWRKAALWACGVVASIGAIATLLALNAFISEPTSKVMMFWVLANAAALLMAGDAVLAGLGVGKASSSAPTATTPDAPRLGSGLN